MDKWLIKIRDSSSDQSVQSQPNENPTTSSASTSFTTDRTKQSKRRPDLDINHINYVFSRNQISSETMSSTSSLDSALANSEDNNNNNIGESMQEGEVSTLETTVVTITNDFIDSTAEKPAKKKALSRSRTHKFNLKWQEIEDFKGWLVQSSQNKRENPIEYAFCKLCNTTTFPNKADLLRHAKTEKHINLTKVVKQTRNIDEIFNQSHFINVKFAELKLAGALAESNLPFTFMDTLSPLCSQIFADSKIAKDLACKRTKTTSIIKENLGKHFQQEVFSLLRKPGNFFSLIMDETTDVGPIKQCGFTVIFFDEHKVVTRFFDLVEIESGNANALYECLKKSFQIKKIPLTNLVGFASDTTNVMVGAYNSVFSHLKSELPYIALIKCSCHMIHLCASKACLELPRRVEDVLRNIGAHFSRSSFRQNKFKEFQIFFQTGIHKILLPSQTRWLSLEQCCSRVLEQYDPLREYFRVLCFEDPSITNDQILETLNNKYTKIYLEFMAYVLNILNNFNTMFQSETPLLHKLKPEVEKIITTTCSNFIEKNRIPKKNILSFDFKNPHNFIPLEKIYLGVAAYASLEEIKTDKNFEQKEFQTFLTSCLKFYLKLISEIKSRFTFDDNLFEIISVIDPNVARSFEIQTLYGILQRFPFLNEFINTQALDNEWREHALLEQDHLNPNLPAEKYWSEVFKLQNAAGQELFKNLKIVISFLLILPFSNASVERLFSDLNNIKTDHRNRLKTDTIVALLATKDGIKSQGGCLNFKPNNKMIRGSIWQKNT